MKNSTFVIEHLEKEMWPWCKIEYENAAKLIKPEKLIISNYGNEKSVAKMNLDWKRVCVLDPKAKEELKPQDSSKFDYFVFGGILGDADFNGRTGEELTEKLPKEVGLRNIGKKQFSTDNALLVTKMILDGKKLNDIKMQNELIIKIKDGEEVILPYCYPVLNGKPQVSSKLISYLKRKKEF